MDTMWNYDELNSNPFYGRDEYEELLFNPYDYDINNIDNLGGGYTETRKPQKRK